MVHEPTLPRDPSLTKSSPLYSYTKDRFIYLLLFYSFILSRYFILEVAIYNVDKSN